MKERGASRDERETRARFTERYATFAPTDLSTDIERRVIGADWGANGYTTVAQADALGGLLDLRPGDLLLDVGTGRGWPGLYLAKATGCRVVGTDMPLVPLRTALGRAQREGLADRTAMVAAAGAALPFRAESFDAIVHTDVLC